MMAVIALNQGPLVRMAAEGNVMIEAECRCYPLNWRALWAGAIVGLAVYVIFTLFGVALGLVSVDVAVDGIRPDNYVTNTWVWTTIAMMTGAFLGSFFAARLCGLARKTDGIMHGLLVWGSTIVLYIVVSSFAPAAFFGGVFTTYVRPSLVEHARGPDTEFLINQLRFRVSAINDSRIFVRQNLDYLNSLLIARDRMGAIRFMTQVMAVDGTSATEAIDKLLYLYAGEAAKFSGQSVNVYRLHSYSRNESDVWRLLMPVIASALASMLGGIAGVRRRSRRVWRRQTA